MGLVRTLLRNPIIWWVSQNVLSSDSAKRTLYRSAVKPPGTRVLDFGCANGNTFPAFADLDYCGVDLDKKFIHDAQKKYAGYPKARFVHGDILNSRFEPGSFDHILFACTGHHLDDDTLTKILVAMSRLLSKTGAIHFFDAIRVPAEDGLVLRMIIRADQGKHYRTRQQYESVFSSLSGHLQVRRAGRVPVPGGIVYHHA